MRGQDASSLRLDSIPDDSLQQLQPKADENTRRLAVPTVAQLDFQDQELSMFMHFGICTFANCDHNDGNAHTHPASLFNPSSLDTDQWARVPWRWGQERSA